jgi:hypothetical protein
MPYEPDFVINKFEMIKALCKILSIGLMESKMFVDTFLSFACIGAIKCPDDYQKFNKFIGILIKYQIKVSGLNFIIDPKAIMELAKL